MDKDDTHAACETSSLVTNANANAAMQNANAATCNMEKVHLYQVFYHAISMTDNVICGVKHVPIHPHTHL